MGASQGDVTGLLREMHAGDPEAQGRLVQTVYDELRRMAADLLRGERPGHSWQATDLAHQVFFRLFGKDLQAQNRSEFFGAASRAMRELLIEHARLRKTQKRGDGWRRVPLDDVADAFERQNLDAAAVHEALDRLAGFHPRQSQVVTLRFFGRYTLDEIAALLEVSVSTVQSDLRIALAWLHAQLGGTKP